MNNNAISRILLITEGKNDSKFFDRIKILFNINVEIVHINANIYKLYSRMKAEDFNCNVKNLILECLPNDISSDKKEDYKNKLKDKYAYIYFVFDFDIQHHGKNEDSDINKNCDKIKIMLEELNNETDETRGKLYINYPMMQSFRDINSFDDIEFISSYISVDDIKNYKSMVSSKRLNGKDILSYSIDNFISIFKLNTNKLFFINGINQKDKNTFLKISKGINIYYKIKDKIDKDFMIYILNTSVFFLSDFKTFNDKYLNSILQ